MIICQSLNYREVSIFIFSQYSSTWIYSWFILENSKSNVKSWMFICEKPLESLWKSQEGLAGSQLHYLRNQTQTSEKKRRQILKNKIYLKIALLTNSGWNLSNQGSINSLVALIVKTLRLAGFLLMESISGSPTPLLMCRLM